MAPRGWGGAFRRGERAAKPHPAATSERVRKSRYPSPEEEGSKRMKLGRLNHIGVAAPSYPFFVTPAQAGVHHRWMKFERQEMDSRLRGNDEFRDLEVAR